MGEITLERKINTVIDFVADPCDAPVSVYVECLIPAARNAIITYFALDLSNLFLGFVRSAFPLGWATRSSKRGGRSEGWAEKKPGDGKKSKPRTWLRKLREWGNIDPWGDAGRAFGKLVNGGVAVPGPGGILFWDVVDIAQRGLNAWMIFEITTDFFYEWTAGVNRTRYCQFQAFGWVMATEPVQGNLPILPRTPCAMSTIIKQRGSCTWFAATGAWSGVAGVASFTGTIVAVPGFDIPGDARLILVNTDTGEEFTSDPLEPHGKKIGIVRKIGGGGHFATYIAGSGFFNVVNPTVSLVCFRTGLV